MPWVIPCLPAFLGFLNLLVREVPFIELLVEVFQVDAIDHLQGVDHVAQALRHLPAVGIPHHGLGEAKQQNTDYKY